jgi:hypothetical protein
MLERDGSVLATTGPVRPSEAKLRRAQALAHSSGAALRIARELISRKIAGQEQVARHKLLDTSMADAIARFGDEVSSADSINTIRLIESQAARAYWSTWSTLPITFPKNDLIRVPGHWCTFGARVSPLTGSPRLAANPPNAILNYLYSVLESEARLAAAALGLDPGLGVLHVDSLACDLMEPVRPQVDAYVIDWITRQPLRREWLFELGNGNCRLSGSFAARLSETARTWGRAVAPIAEWVARAIWSTIRRPDTPFTTRLTQANKREVKGKVSPSSIPAPKPENVCLGCGKPVAKASTRCTTCAVEVSKGKILEVARRGRIASKSSESRARVAATQRRQQTARWSWQPSSQPDWLTEETYTKQIQPRLIGTTLSEIASAIGVTIPYASDIRKGRRRPHPRHWRALARLVDIEAATDGNNRNHQ